MSRTVRRFSSHVNSWVDHPERDGENHHGIGFEWMSGRLGNMFDEPGKYTKLLTHRLERRAANDDIRLQLKDGEE